MVACPPAGCQFAFDDPRVKIKGSAFGGVVANPNCEQNILVLTDDPGLFDINDGSSGAFLDASSQANRVKELASISDVAAHWNICAAVYRDLACFFNYTQRPPTVLVGFVDTAGGETLSDAFGVILQCPVCACQVQTATYKLDGTSWIDSQEYLDFTNLISQDDNWYHNGMTFQASTAFTDPFETTSWAAQAAAQGQNQEWTLADYSCDVERDADCVPILDVDGNTTPVNFYNNSGLGAAALKAFYALSDPSYNFNVYAAPSSGVHGCHTGRFIDENTGDEMNLGLIGQSALANLTGLQEGRGAPISGVTRHLSAFLNIESGIRYFSSIYVTGVNYGDVFFKEKAVYESIRLEMLQFQDQYGLTFDLKTVRLLGSRLRFILDGWVSRGVINPVAVDWEGQGYANILINGQAGNGEGYVINYIPLADVPQVDIQNRDGFTVGVCFVVNTPQNGLCLQICEVPPLLV